MSWEGKMRWRCGGSWGFGKRRGNSGWDLGSKRKSFPFLESEDDLLFHRIPPSEDYVLLGYFGLSTELFVLCFDEPFRLDRQA